MKNMNNKFDELTKSFASSVTRRQALHRLRTGLAGLLLACIGIGGGRSVSAKGTLNCCTYECESIDGSTIYRQRFCYDSSACPVLVRCRLVNGHLVNDCSKCKNS